ncbi:MAG: LamG domain-containing protein, partial [Planctomycetota bacterium]
CIFAFLDPDEDGTTLADIPGKYYGLRSKLDREKSEMYQREMHKIRAGIEYTDQSTPLAALVAIFAGAMSGNADLYKAVALMTQEPDNIQNSIENSKYWADQLDFLSAPQWPKNPGNGYVHPIYLCRKGSLIAEIVQRMVHEDGKWYSYYGNWKEPADSEHVTSKDIAAAKAKGYLCDWEVAGPYIQRGKMHKDKKHDELFDIPFGPELPGADVPWQSVKVEPCEQHPASVNISSALLPIDQSVAYLRTEIVSDAQKPVRLEIFTDDGVKAWLNGKVIHENNNSRGIEEQPDAVNVTLNQGLNQLMLKVTEDIWGSRAIVRLGSDRAAGPRPADKAIHPKTQVRLDWTPAAAARSHRVYFGTDENDLSLLAEVSNPQELQPQSLETDRRYYWRVDEVLADGSKMTGDVWSFATSKQVARWTFDGHANDQSLQAFHGAIHGNPRWVPGVSSQAVALSSEEDYIIIPPMNLNTDAMTITLWVKTEDVIENPGLVFARDASTSAGLWLNMNNNLRYNWNDDQQTWLWDSGLFVPNKTWTFAALTVDPQQATIYMHDGTAMKSATHKHTHGMAKFDGVTYIGHDPRWSTVKGAIDEVRIYNYALDAKEIEAIYLETAKKST